MDGVISTRVGYTGGDRANPTYASVCGGDGHTEAIRVEFDPSVLSYEDLLDRFWLANHDPCQPLNPQYRSAVWPQNDAQRRAVLAKLDEVERLRGRPVYTVVEAPKTFWNAEWYHQQYNNKNKLRLAAALGVFALNNLPHGAFPGQETAKTLLGGLVFASLLPQLVAPFDRILSAFD